MRFTGFIVGITVLLFSGASQAILIDNGDFTTDTSSGSDWLDLSFNTRITYDDMIATDLNGYGAQGYRYATLNEVLALWVNAGIPNVPSYGNAVRDVANSPALLALETLIGRTAGDYTAGFVSDIDPGSPSSEFRYVPWFRVSTGQLVAEWSQPTDRWNGYEIASWLVRDSAESVPVPATIALFGLGLVGLGWSRRKKA
jgi:PEP-CTERM motif